MSHKTVYLVKGGEEIIKRLGYDPGPYLLLNESRSDFIANNPPKEAKNEATPEDIRAKDITWAQVLDENLSTPLDFSVNDDDRSEHFKTTIELDESLTKEKYKFVEPFHEGPIGSLKTIGISIIEVRERKNHTVGGSVERVTRMPNGKPIEHFIKKLSGGEKEISFEYHGKKPLSKKEDVFFRYKLFLNRGENPTQIFIDPIIRNDGSRRP